MQMPLDTRSSLRCGKTTHVGGPMGRSCQHGAHSTLLHKRLSSTQFQAFRHSCTLHQATGGGGGIGIYICNSHDEVVDQFPVAARQGQANFGDSGSRCSVCHFELQVVLVQGSLSLPVLQGLLLICGQLRAGFMRFSADTACPEAVPQTFFDCARPFVVGVFLEKYVQHARHIEVCKGPCDTSVPLQGLAAALIFLEKHCWILVRCLPSAGPGLWRWQGHRRASRRARVLHTAAPPEDCATPGRLKLYPRPSAGSSHIFVAAIASP